jgi:lipoprotein NlpI
MLKAAFILAMFLLAIPAWSQSAGDLVKLGNQYSSKGDYAKAIESYSRALRLEPNSATTFHARGYAYYRSHSDSQAIRDFSEAIRLEPAYSEAFHDRGRAFEDKGDYEHAIKDYTQAMSLKSSDPDLLYDRAFDYERNGEYALAVADLNEVVRRFPFASDAHRNRGLALLFSAGATEAQEDLSRAVELNPSEPYNVIWLYIARAKNAGRAEEELARNATKLKLEEWPGPVIQLFLGKNNPEKVLQAALDKESQKSSQQRCEAVFYIGEYEALHRRRKAARQNFRRVSENCSKNYFLYVPAARAELRSRR